MNKRTLSIIGALLAVILVFAAMPFAALAETPAGDPGDPWTGEFDESELEGDVCSKEGHTWGGWVIVQEPDGIKPGYATDTCLVCGEVETRILVSEINEDACPYCGKVHPGFLGLMIRFVHLIYKFFGDLLG